MEDFDIFESDLTLTTTGVESQKTKMQLSIDEYFVEAIRDFSQYESISLSKVQEGRKTTSSKRQKKLSPEVSKVKSLSLIDIEGTKIINPWRTISSFSSRILEIYKDLVVLEVIVDSEEELVEEREMDISMFEGLVVEEGCFFKINCYERPREQRLEIVDGKGIVNEDDFPKVDFDDITGENLFF